ncbi:MAG: hypothetical protein K6B13_14055 [Prevotella sp.]|nr:hypothetical protein [Prevotella sp.]
MMNEEQYLRNRMGSHNPFTVPEGYFEQLTQQVMDKIPTAAMTPLVNEEPPVRKPARVAVMKRLRPWLYAAACICVGVFIAALAFNDRSEVAAPQAASQQIAVNTQADSGYYSDTYIDEEADYAMIDNQEIYACLMADMYY